MYVYYAKGFIVISIGLFIVKINSNWNKFTGVNICRYNDWLVTGVFYLSSILRDIAVYL